MSTPRQSKSKWQFSIVFWLFITLSFPLAIGLVLFAAGYRFDRDTGQVTVSSALAIDTTPTGATVLIDNVAEDGTTPFIKTIHPGRHSVTMEKDGFYSWSKELDFSAGESILFPNAQLFLESLPVTREKPSQNEVKSLVSSYTTPASLPEEYYAYYKNQGWSDPSQLLFLDGPKKLIIDNDRQESFLIDRLDAFNRDNRIDGELKIMQWLENSFLYGTPYELSIYRIDNDTHNVITRQSKPIGEAVWHPSGGYILYSQENGLYALELDDRDRRQSWKLSTLPNAEQFLFSSRARDIHFQSDDSWYTLKLR